MKITHIPHALSTLSLGLDIEDGDATNEQIIEEICKHIAAHRAGFQQWMVDCGYEPYGADPEARSEYLSNPANWVVDDDDSGLELSCFVLEAYVGGDTERHLEIDFEID